MIKKYRARQFRDRDDSLVMVDVNGGGGRVMVPGNIMRDPRVFRLNMRHWNLQTDRVTSIIKMLAVHCV